ncbi:hypothetical protein Ahy_B05g076979 [Arachis hypogaea]|uniref:Heparanase-like protein n=1 Tax=Arachis hypogaea TaxID=3818 RepID=A0A444Z4J4_ARAHY|nr:hypothetical protein Ahy_B05g076979 [Arachis hypogaea]
MCMGVAAGAYILTLFAGYTGDKENLGKCEQVYFRAKVIFGLNALVGRTLQSGSAVGPWNSSNAESFICYTVRKNYSIAGWEFGNELCGSGVGANVSADQYASDIAALRNIFHDVYRGIRHKPLIIAPGGFYDANWFQEFVNKSGKSVDVVSHHIYNLGAGIIHQKGILLYYFILHTGVDEHLIERILDPSYLDGVASTFSGLKNILQKSATKAKAWVGEAGGAYNNGHHLVSDAFVYSFWYLDQLGMSTVYDTRTYCRQSLVGGNYGLLNTSTFVPNPDYYRYQILNFIVEGCAACYCGLSHFSFQVLADRSPGLLDFHLDLVSLEAATKDNIEDDDNED